MEGGGGVVGGVAEGVAGGACGVLYDGGYVSVFGDGGVLGGAVSGAVVWGCGDGVGECRFFFFGFPLLRCRSREGGCVYVWTCRR